MGNYLSEWFSVRSETRVLSCSWSPYGSQPTP